MQRQSPGKWPAWQRAAACACLAVLGSAPARPQGAPDAAVVALPPALQHGRELLQAQRFVEARAVFADFLKAHPAAIQAEMGLGDAELGLRELEAAEATYRQVTAVQPQLWQAHKDLVVVEAALGRWEEFDRERTVLRMARDRGAPGISPRESDLIDTFNIAGGHWIVRAYYQPVGRSKARYNFERFSPQGRVEAYLSLEDPVAARAALTPGDVRIGTTPGAGSSATPTGPLVLNWYTGAAHGTIRSFGMVPPTYEQLRAEVRRWLLHHPELVNVKAKTQDPATPSAETHRTP